jgi:hypothetical protein
MRAKRTSTTTTSRPRLARTVEHPGAWPGRGHGGRPALPAELAERLHVTAKPSSAAAGHATSMAPAAGQADAMADASEVIGDLHLATVVINVQDMHRAVGFWTAALG